MRKHFAVFVAVLVMLGLSAPLGLAQSSATVKGVCKDLQGNPIVDGIVIYVSQTTGQKYPLKTNKKGEYYSLGLTSGSYNVTLYKNDDDYKAGKELFHANGFPVALGENTLDFDLKKEQETSRPGPGLDSGASQADAGGAGKGEKGKQYD